MRKVALIVSLIIFISADAYAGSVKIDRTWTDDDWINVLVTYINNTKETFSDVTIQCIAYETKESKIDIGSAYFFGPIEPGFEGTEKILIEHHNIPVKFVNCDCMEMK